MRYKLYSVILSSAFALTCFGQVNVLTWHNDLARTGQNTAESILSSKTVQAKSFGLLFSLPADGKVDTQPLYVSGVWNGGVLHDAVFFASEHDTVYAYDANTRRLLWKVSLLGAGETPSDARSCDQVTPEIGVTATPVIDLTAGPHGTIYLVAMSKDAGGNYYQRLHALDITSGAEEFGGPKLIQATYPGTGANSSGGNVVFDAKQYKSRPGLLLLNGVVYTSWGSHCDINPYTGWLIGYDHLSLKQTSVFNFAPNGQEAALWNGGAGPAADAQGNIFVSVANGTFDTSIDSHGFPLKADFGNSFVKLSTSNGTLAAVDYWTMYNTVSESNSDTDLGSGGIMLLPDVTDGNGGVHQLAVGAGKDRNFYVVDRNNMGKYDPTSDATIYQQLTGALSGGAWSSPAYWNGHVYMGSVNGRVLDFAVSPSTNARLEQATETVYTFAYPGVTPSVSAKGTANGIMWVASNTNPSVLRAFDATNLGTELYNSTQAANGRDNFGQGNKWVFPTVANGEVFVPTVSSVAVFGVLPSSTVANGTYVIANQLSTLVLDDPGATKAAGTQMIQWQPNGGSNQSWVVSRQANGYYLIQNLSSGMYLRASGTADGAAVEQAPSDGSDLQYWSLTTSGSGYVIKNKASGRVVDDTAFSLQQGNKIVLWSPTGNSNQNWILYPGR